MRPRIAMAIVTSKNDGAVVCLKKDISINYRETKEEVERGKRRANFERNRRKLRSTIEAKEVDLELVSFNNGIAEAIAKFKQNKRCS